MREIDRRLDMVASELSDISVANYKYFNKGTYVVPDRNSIIDIIKAFQSVIFPEYFLITGRAHTDSDEALSELFSALRGQISVAFSFLDEPRAVDTEEYAYRIIEALPRIKDALIKDVLAIYEGDPAARSPEEVILCYPGFYAISIYRIAHELYTMGVPYIPRIMTEYAHEKTGIDIHAGATIGESFFIDHGTGIVIGETTTIGKNVKIYQGVTLGAKSFEVGDDGNPIKGIKRHPDIGNNCVIYANATILGGNTKIGDGSVIGASVWLTSSVEPGTTVYNGIKNKP